MGYTVIKPEDKIAPADATEQALYEGLGTLAEKDLDYANRIRTGGYESTSQQGLYDSTLANIADYNQRFADFGYTGELNQQTDDNLMQIYANQISNIDNYANTGVGGMMNQMANRGVINSSATGKAFGDIANQANNQKNDAFSNYMNTYMDAYNKQYDAEFKNLLMEQANTQNEYGFMQQAYDQAYSKPASMWETTRNARYGNEADYISESSGGGDDGQMGQMMATVAMMAVVAFSDENLKENITTVNEADGSPCKINGHQIYDWDWNEKGQELTGQTQGRGVIAQEIQKTRPDAIILDENSEYLMVDYSKLFGEKE